MQRNSSFFPPFALLLALGALGACSDGGGGKKEPQDAGDDGGSSTVDEPDASGEEVDADGPCVPQGCEEQGFECGTAEDGCGNPLDCTGVKVCEYPEVCGPDNRCGCTPKTCEELSSLDAAQACGLRDDGCGGQIECGGCVGFTGDRWTCSTGVCACPAATKETACAGRACGTVSDGCGGDNLDCGSCASPAQACSDVGACECKSNDEYAATACAGKTCGTVTVDGCTYTCGGACANSCTGAQNCKTEACGCPGATQCNGSGQCCTPVANPCAGKACGTEVVDTCTGARTVCGCAGGQTCVDQRYVLGASANTCVSDAQAAVLGAYMVRTHSFQEFFGGLQRAETVSRVRVMRRQDGGLELQDTGCVATTVSQSGTTRSIASAYFNVPTTRNAFSVNGSTFERTAANAEATGFSPTRPAFCGASGTTPSMAADYAVYAATAVDSQAATPSSGSTKAWLPGDKQCKCAAASCTGTNWNTCLPALNRGTDDDSTDCRLNDIDNDGLPGFTAIATTNATSTTPNTTRASAVSVGQTQWLNGRVVAGGYHVAEGPTDLVEGNADPGFRQSFTSCTTDSLVSCLGLSTNAAVSCRAEFNRVQFTRLSPEQDAVFGCQQFYSSPLATVAASTTWPQLSGRFNQAAVDAYFNGTNKAGPSVDFPACTTSAQCPDGMLCKGQKCYPKTSPNACTVLNSSDECGTGWTCQTSPAAPYTCWPSSLTSCRTAPGP